MTMTPMRRAENDRTTIARKDTRIRRVIEGFDALAYLADREGDHAAADRWAARYRPVCPDPGAVRHYRAAAKAALRVADAVRAAIQADLERTPEAYRPLARDSSIQRQVLALPAGGADGLPEAAEAFPVPLRAWVTHLDAEALAHLSKLSRRDVQDILTGCRTLRGTDRPWEVPTGDDLTEVDALLLAALEETLEEEAEDPRQL